MQSLKAVARTQYLMIGFWVKRCVQKPRNASDTPVGWLSPRETIELSEAFLTPSRPGLNILYELSHDWKRETERP